MGSIAKVSVVKGENTPPFLRNRSLHYLLERNARDNPQATALIHPDLQGKTWTETYSELSLTSNKLCRAILERVATYSPNLDNDYVIAVALPPSHRLVELLLAVWKAGAAYLPIDHNAPMERTRHILNEAKPVLLVTEYDEGKEAYGKTPRASLEELEAEGELFSDTAISDGERLDSSTDEPIAIILYTSGSTGIPKGVRVSHRAILNRLEWQWTEFPYAIDEQTLVFKTALTFVDSVSEIWGPLLTSRPRALLVLPREVTRDPQSLVKILYNYKIQRLVLVPTLLRSILMYMKLSKSHAAMVDELRLWVCSGEPLSVSLAQEFLEAFRGKPHVLCNFYGSTEVMGDVTYHVIAGPGDCDFAGKVPIGVPVSNTAIYLLDKSLRPVAQGELGEIYAAGRNLASGYVNRRDPERFIDNHLTVDPDYKYLYRTGDYGRLVKGVLIFEGRTDSQIKVRGHRVDLSEVEAALSKITGIKKAIVLCYKPGELNQAVLGFILPEDNTVLFEKDLEVALQSFLPSYAIPQIVVIDTLPLLVNGKVDRQYLLKHYEQLCFKDNADAEWDVSDISEERREIAKALYSTVASVLGTRGSINSSANFYELGGNSLNSVYTVTLLRDQGYFICISDFIAAKSLGEIIKIISINENELPSGMKQFSNKFSYKMLDHSHKEEVYKIITDSFYSKADLERWIEPSIQRIAYTELMDQLWESLVEKNLSCVVLSETGKIIGASLNFDAYDEPEVTITSDLNIVFNFLEYLEGPIRERKLPQGMGKILHSFMAGTHEELSAGENVEVMEYMEVIDLEIAKAGGFQGVFTTNTSPLTQQLGTDVFNYTVLNKYQVNQYVAPDGTRPFKEAPNTQVAVCCWKLV